MLLIYELNFELLPNILVAVGVVYWYKIDNREYMQILPSINKTFASHTNLANYGRCYRFVDKKSSN